ncbi:MAG TPA: amidohydrolase family protein [Gemmatimonadales bacterium]|nr:amidohydrolase family protein [Gemmatimonadales bacterium]
MSTTIARLPLLLLLATAPGGGRSPAPPDPALSPGADSLLVLRGGARFDPRTGTVQPNGAIVVRNGRVVAVQSPNSVGQLPSNARVVDLEGRTVLPGLIDAHVHLTLAGDPDSNALATLRAGFTTVVDLGSADGAGARLRDAIAQGHVAGPRVIAAGSWIGAKGGVCEFGGATVNGAAEAAARTRSDLAAGADLIKVCVTGWPKDAVAFPDSVELAAGPLDAVMKEASAARRMVFAHAIGQAGALLAASHGVTALAHTPVVDSTAAAALRRSRIQVISTLASLGPRPGGAEVVASFRRLRAAGVPIVLGTDAGVLPHGQNGRELIALTDAGLTPAEALRAAMVDAARLIGRSELGEIKVGAAGDFVVVNGDPLRDITIVQRPELVVHGGRIVQ